MNPFVELKRIVRIPIQVDNLVSAAVLGLKNMHGFELKGYKRSEIGRAHV